MVTVYIPTAFRKFSGDRDQVEVAGGSSLRQVIVRLEVECPGIKDQMMFNGGVHPGLAIFVNDEQISQGLIEQIPEDATLRILPAMGGGSLRDGVTLLAADPRP
ncbi:MAG TPA: MoaD/ThiS family protein [Dehalococcoidia bacterium]|nr:MoaD/ThiS family protein [Dehalococcoidia bacterium]